MVDGGIRKRHTSPTSSEPRWHPTLLLYKTPMTLQTLTLRVPGSFEKRLKKLTTGLILSFRKNFSWLKISKIEFKFLTGHTLTAYLNFTDRFELVPVLGFSYFSIGNKILGLQRTVSSMWFEIVSPDSSFWLWKNKFSIPLPSGQLWWKKS